MVLLYTFYTFHVITFFRTQVSSFAATGQSNTVLSEEVEQMHPMVESERTATPS